MEQKPLLTSTKETVIYENDFSSADLAYLDLFGGFAVRDGRLCTTSGEGPSAHLTYTLPREYDACDYRVEVDVYGHVSGDHEGLLIGARSEKMTTAPAYFSGYTCTLFGKYTTIAYFDETGFGGAFSTGIGSLKSGGDYHLSATLRHGILRFEVTSLADGHLVQSYRFETGKCEGDPYNAFTRTVGLRKYYNDSKFANFKVTVLSDILPDALAGDCRGNYQLAAHLDVREETTLFFGMKDRENGYAVTFAPQSGRATFFRVENGRFVWMAERALVLKSKTYPLSVTSAGGVLSVRFDDYPFPIFEFPISDGEGAYGVVGGELSDVRLSAAPKPAAAETYVNPLNDRGADPDMIFHNGVYYLYVYANSGDKLFMLYTSTDLVHFTKQDYVFPWDDAAYANIKKGSPWSPNVFYHAAEDLFYLTYAALPADGSPRTLYYATSKSPYGPFSHDGAPTAIHKGVNEIDGHLYSFDDGKVYISLSRYDCKGDVWLEEVELKDGRILPKTETAVRVIVPAAPYENDGGNALCEGGSLYKHGDYYYLLYATAKYNRHYGEAYAVAKHPLGPYTRAENNPILQYNAFLDGPGDALLIPSPDGSELFIVYHRHDHVGQCDPRKTCVDRAAFIKNPNGGADLLVVCGPSTTPQKMPSNKK